MGKQFLNVGSLCTHEDMAEASWLEQASGEGVPGIGSISQPRVESMSPCDFYPRHVFFSMGTGRCRTWHISVLPYLHGEPKSDSKQLEIARGLRGEVKNPSLWSSYALLRAGGPGSCALLTS